MARALIFIGDLAIAKSRLAGRIPPTLRRSLALAMLSDVITAARSSGLFSRIDVLAGCSAGLDRATELGAIASLDADSGGHCLNTRVAAWIHRARPAADIPLVLLHADLPFLTPEALQQLLQYREAGSVIIATDVAGTGTNAIAMLPGQLDRFAFGADSARKHGDLCVGRGERCDLVRVPGLDRDIDTPEDLDLAEQRCDTQRTGVATHNWFREHAHDLAVA